MLCDGLTENSRYTYSPQIEPQLSYFTARIRSEADQQDDQDRREPQPLPKHVQGALHSHRPQEKERASGRWTKAPLIHVP